MTTTPPDHTASLIKRIAAIAIAINIIIVGAVRYRFGNISKQSVTIDRETFPESMRMCHMENCRDLAVARTPNQRNQGLMHVTDFPTGSGMIFIFDEPSDYSFWMKNTKIPLDMIRVRHEAANITDTDGENKTNTDKEQEETMTGRIMDVQTATPCTADPCPSYTPSASAHRVIELNAGQTEKFEILPDDIITISTTK